MTIAPYVPPSSISLLPRGNMLLWSGALSSAPWFPGNASIVANAANDQYGLPTADVLVPDVTSNLHFVLQNITVVAGKPYTFSICLQANAHFIALVRAGDGLGNHVGYFFNLNSGQPTGASDITGNAIPVAFSIVPTLVAGIWRCSITLIFPTSTTLSASVYACDDLGNSTWTGDGSNAINLSQAQVEPYNSASAYAYTTTAADPGIWAGVQGLPVLPFLPGQAIAMSKSPLWSTERITMASGRERTTSYWPSPLWQFELSHEVVRRRPTNDELSILWEFFNSAAGQFAPFLVVDPTDCQVPASAPAVFGLGDGVANTWQLQRSIRSWSEPVFDVYSPIILDAGALAGPYTISPNGVITFATPPASGHLLSWFGYFYFGCRFMQDDLGFEQIVNQLWSGKSLKFRSVRP